MDAKYVSMARAAGLCSYSKDYLSLLARRGEMRAEKIGGNWYTTVEWLNEYLKIHKADEVIVSHREHKIVNPKVVSRINKKLIGGFVLFGAIIIFSFFYFSGRLKSVEERSRRNTFVPEEITKVPNDAGGYDVYGVGKVKMGTE